MSRDRDVNAVPPVVNRTRSDGSLSDATPWYTVDGDRGKGMCLQFRLRLGHSAASEPMQVFAKPLP